MRVTEAAGLPVAEYENFISGGQEVGAHA
jgi:hypothetical protein